MVKKLQRRFILIAVLSVLAVLVVIMGIINVSNYRNVVVEADKTITLISSNGGTFPRSEFHKNGSGSGNGSGAGSGANGSGAQQPISTTDIKPPNSGKNDLTMSAEAPFETRYFVVDMSTAGKVSTINTGSIAAVSTTQAAEYAAEVYASGKSSGFIGDYRFGVSDTDTGKMVVFLDCGRSINYFRTFLRTSLIVSLLALLGVFVLVMIFSKRAIKPIADAYEKQKHFITDAGHELKTPLAVISANTEVLEMTDGESEWTQSIRNQVTRLTELTNNLVSLARMDEHDSRMLMTDFSLSDAVTESLEPFYALAEQKGKPVEASIQEGLSLCGNEDAIRKLVGILADNAIKYGAENSEISVTLKASGHSKLLQTKNRVEGGIEKGSHEEMFERFYRGDVSHSSQVSGYGIGLSMARAIAAAHKGKISARSEDGCSLTITVTL